MKAPSAHWNQSLSDNVLETAILLITIAFLCHVVKLAFFEKDDD